MRFRISNGNDLLLHFPEQGSCLLIADAQGKTSQTPTTFRKQFNCRIGFVPILGPLEHNENLFEKKQQDLPFTITGLLEIFEIYGITFQKNSINLEDACFAHGREWISKDPLSIRPTGNRDFTCSAPSSVSRAKYSGRALDFRSGAKCSRTLSKGVKVRFF